MTRDQELEAMLAKSRRYLASAETLRRQEDFDSAISRSYYAMFYAAEAALFDKGLSFSSHRAVISGFAQQFVKTKRLPPEMHQWLREGFEKRQFSDYEFLTRINDADVIDLMSKAERFLVRIEALLDESKRADKG